MDIDITQLTSEQLAAIQAQLKEAAKARKAERGSRMSIIEDMLRAKDEHGSFVYSTRDIAMALSEQGLGLSEDELEDKDAMAQEIRRIQAKKQHLERLTDKAGNLVHAEGTFGYKPSHNFSNGTAMAAGKVKAETVMEFIRTRLHELELSQIQEIANLADASL